MLVAIGNDSSVATVITITEGSTRDNNKIVAGGVGVGVSLGVLSAVLLGAGFLWRRKTRVKYEGLPVQKPVTTPEGQKMFAALQLHGSNPIYEANNPQIEVPSELPVPEGKWRPTPTSSISDRRGTRMSLGMRTINIGHKAALHACIETDGHGGCCIQRNVDRREPRSIASPRFYRLRAGLAAQFG